MQVAIVGYGSQGVSSLNYWSKDGHSITVCDKNEDLDLPEGVAAQLGAGYLKGLDRFDLIVRAPSVHPKELISANTAEILSRVSSNTNEFIHICPSKNLIGVTGTKGKGTTSTLITKMLQAAGHKVHLGGNIGTPPLDLLKGNIQPDDYVVLELANFQLIDLKQSPHVAVCLMVEPEHLDWHTDIDEYIEAKQQLFKWQSANDIAVYYGQNELSQKVASVSPGQKIPYFSKPGAQVVDGRITINETAICSVSEVGLLGEHNLQNICAALTAVWNITQDVSAIKSAVQNLKGLPFRIEPRQEKNGIRFYNDSFATAPGATAAAIRAIPGKKVLIIGGHDRGLNLEPLADVIKRDEMNIQKVVLIGQAAGRASEALDAKNYSNYVIESSKNMKDIVRRASEFAHNGDAVVLSPAFASFDMFKNFEDRGIQFNQAVDGL